MSEEALVADEINLELLFNWVTLSEDKEPQNSNLAQLILERYKALPSKVTAKTPISHDVETFLRENLSSVERSSILRFTFVNSGRVAVQSSGGLLLLSSLLCITVLPFFHLFSASDMECIRIVACVAIPITSLLSIFAEEISKYIVAFSKPGDILRILQANDEMIPVRRSSLSLKNGRPTESHGVVVISKKTMLCENFVRLFSTRQGKRFSDYVTCYLCIDFLLLTGAQGLKRQSLVEKAIIILKYLYAFQRDSRFLVFQLGILHLEICEFNQARELFMECIRMNGEDWISKAWISVINFIEMSNPTKFST